MGTQGQGQGSEKASHGHGEIETAHKVEPPLRALLSHGVIAADALTRRRLSSHLLSRQGANGPLACRAQQRRQPARPLQDFLGGPGHVRLFEVGNTLHGFQ